MPRTTGEGHPVSDTPRGPGWWQASDGKFYPPELHPLGPAGSTPLGGGDPSYGGELESTGLVRSLYDFKFDHFATPKLIRFFYAFIVIVLSIGAAILMLASLASGESGSVVVGLFVVPIAYAVYLIMTRIYFELVAALFRIADDVRAIRRGKGL